MRRPFTRAEVWRTSQSTPPPTATSASTFVFFGSAAKLADTGAALCAISTSSSATVSLTGSVAGLTTDEVADVYSTNTHARVSAASPNFILQLARAGTHDVIAVRGPDSTSRDGTQQ